MKRRRVLWRSVGGGEGLRCMRRAAGKMAAMLSCAGERSGRMWDRI